MFAAVRKQTLTRFGKYLTTGLIYLLLESRIFAAVRKQDIFTAKNYLTNDELDTLNRLVVIFLESAELRAKSRKAITMTFWKENVDRMLVFNDKPVLPHKGSISNKQMEKEVRGIYELFDARRKVFEAKQADLEDITLIEQEIKKQRP